MSVYLIPTFLAADAIDCLPAYIIPAIKKCKVIFTENERTTRRYIKQLDRSFVIDDFTWHSIANGGLEQITIFTDYLKQGTEVAIFSEAGCPAVADPGQLLVNRAQQLGVEVKPLVGPNSILLALMGSGFNGQKFSFLGYLPIDAAARQKAIRQAEANSRSENSTQIFIETPYRNNQMLQALLLHCHPDTKVCVAVNLTAATEKIVTLTCKEWKLKLPELHKQPAIFLLQAER